MHRRQAREFVLAALYQREFREVTLEELLADADPGDQRGYIEQAFFGGENTRNQFDVVCFTRSTHRV